MRRQESNGFTIVEVIVTLVVVTLFLGFFFQMYISIEYQRMQVARHSLASDVAYTNLRKFVVRPTPSILPCVAETMDLTSSPDAKTGALIGHSDTDTDTTNSYGFRAEPTSVTEKLGNDVEQIVKAYAPQGCDEPDYTNTPLKIQSIVTYGNGEKVIHANFVN